MTNAKSYKLEAMRYQELNNVKTRKNLNVIIRNNIKMSDQFRDAIMKTNMMLSLI